MVIFKAIFYDVWNDKHIEHYMSFDGYIASNIQYAWFRALEQAHAFLLNGMTLETLEIIAY